MSIIKPKLNEYGSLSYFFTLCSIFTESAHWADSVYNPCLLVCLYVPSQKPRFPVYWRLLVKECIANIGIPLDI